MDDNNWIYGFNIFVYHFYWLDDSCSKSPRVCTHSTFAIARDGLCLHYNVAAANIFFLEVIRLIFTKL